MQVGPIVWTLNEDCKNEYKSQVVLQGRGGLGC